jgi:hypothetical protein
VPASRGGGVQGYRFLLASELPLNTDFTIDRLFLI